MLPGDIREVAPLEGEAGASALRRFEPKPPWGERFGAELDQTVGSRAGGLHLSRRRLLQLGASLLLAGAAFVITSSLLRESRSKADGLRAAEIASHLRTGLATPVEALFSLQAFLSVSRSEPLTPAQFREFCRPAITRHPEIAALEWFPLVAGADRELFEREVRKYQPGFEIREPTRAGDLVRAVPRVEHVPLTFMEPLAPQVLGLDLAFDPSRLAPVHPALSSGRAMLTDRFQLLEDPPDVLSVAAHAPVTNAVWTDPGNRVSQAFERGVAVILFRLSPLIERTLRAQDLGGMALDLVDPRAPAEARSIYRRGQSRPGATPYVADVPFVDRTYRLTVYPGAASSSWAAACAFAMVFFSSSLTMALFEARRKARRLGLAARKLGQYQLEARIASGGMGTVYLARHALLRRPTAIKIAHAEQAPAHFEREVLLTSTLTHPNTVVVYDFGRGTDGTFYCAMEYIAGYDFEQLVRDHGRLPAARTIRLLLQVAGALDEAHETGLVHRDVKPSNLMLTERGGTKDFVKVLDFGLARPLQKVHAGAGASAAFAGTPGYVAPEVIAGSAATPRSDVFSLGAVAYFLLAGRAPFAAPGSAAESLTRTLTVDPDPLPADVPEPLTRLVLACLARNQEDRPRSMPAVSDQLREALPSCTPWGRADAREWWMEHPRPTNLSPTVGRTTFFPAGRQVTGARRSPRRLRRL